MEELVDLDVKISQRFMIFCSCSSKLYNITLQGSSLDRNNSYFVHYNFPDSTVKETKAEAVSEHELLVKGPPEFDHPCTVNVEVFANDSEQSLAKFSLDLVSPMEYLFRSLSLDDQETSSKISNKMNSAMLAMALSYYYVMGEDVNKEEKADQILSTLLKHSAHDRPNGRGQRIGNSSNMMQFAQRYQLSKTLRCLSVEDGPILSPKSKPDVPLVSLKKKDLGEVKSPVKPRISPRNFQNTHQPPGLYTSLSGTYRTESDESEYTGLLHDHSRKAIDEPRRKQKIQRDQSYEEIKEGMFSQDYEEIANEQLYEEPKNVQRYKEPTNAPKKEKQYEEPDDTIDQSLGSPIYIVPDPEELQRMEHLYQDVIRAYSTATNSDHLSVEKKETKHKRSKSMEFLDYTEVKSPPARPPPPIFSKGASNHKTGLTKYNTLSRLEKRTVLQTFSSVRSDETLPQFNEKSAVKRDLTPSPKPRHVTRIYS